MISWQRVRLFDRRSSLRRSRLRYCSRLCGKFMCIASFLLFISILYHIVYTIGPTYVEPPSCDMIVSLTTTPERFHFELPLTMHSLLSQSVLPKEIRIYLSPTSEILRQQNLTLLHLKSDLYKLDSSANLQRRFDKLVKILLENKDYGPATKFIPIIKEFSLKTQTIMICDDDQYYQSKTVEILNKSATIFPNSIIGFRGWRVREDLKWGVRLGSEIGYHIVESQYISEAYRVGIITATWAYVIHSNFFNAEFFHEFDKLPDHIRHVDDIFMNAQAAKRNITRYVMPSCCQQMSVTRTHVLQRYFGKRKTTRFAANTEALTWFGQYWEKNLWYRFHGENAPKYRSFFTLIYREWTCLLIQLRFIFYFGYM